MSEVLDLLRKISEQLATKDIPKLWSVREVAAYLGLSRAQVYEKVITRSDFPAGINPTGDRMGQKRWKPSEVIDWAEEHARMRPAPRRVTKTKAAA